MTKKILYVKAMPSGMAAIQIIIHQDNMLSEQYAVPKNGIISGDGFQRLGGARPEVRRMGEIKGDVSAARMRIAPVTGVAGNSACDEPSIPEVVWTSQALHGEEIAD
jgi:hypothetical protein